MFDSKKELLDWEKCFESKDFDKKYYYKGELGNIYTKKNTIFRVWSPVASSVILKLYENDGYEEQEGDRPFGEYPMICRDKGVWEIIVDGDLKDKYYTYELSFNNIKVVNNKENIDAVNYRYVEKGDLIITETADMNGKASGRNGLRTMIIDLTETNPCGWEKDVKPKFVKYTDAIIYELHVRDFSADISSGMKYKKQYLAFSELNTRNKYGDFTGIDHIKDLGVTHVHLLPLQDYGSIDEGDLTRKNYNWGYDPLNYNVPEGSYSTDAEDGKVRIKEFKEVVKALHKAGVRVVMDVVYNHTFDTKNSLFDRTFPNYYHRTEAGVFTNGSGCGNETASNRKMFRKYMIDSLVYWAKEFHIDGFRFDLMAVHDIETMNAIRRAMNEIDSSILLYGEGWTGGESKLEYDKAAFKNNARKITNVAMFNDDGRDAIKGSVFIADSTGYATGGMFKDNAMFRDKENLINNVKFMLEGSGEHPQVKTVTIENKTKENVYAWADEPSKVINYVSAHDNWTLWDKINVSNRDETKETMIRMDKLSMAIVMLSQGIPFIHAGDEFLRSKENSKCKYGYDDNSYMSGDEVNSIKWNDKNTYDEVYKYYKGLIELRKSCELLRMDNREEINSKLEFDNNKNGLIICKIKDNSNKIKMINVFNGSLNEQEVRLPDEDIWGIYVNEDKASNISFAEVRGKITIPSISAISLIRN